MCPHLMAGREVMKLTVEGFSDAMKCSRCREGRKFSKYEIDREADGASPSRPRSQRRPRTVTMAKRNM